MRSIAACRAVKGFVETGEHGRLLGVTAHRLGSHLRAGSPDHKHHYSDPTTELMTFDLDFIGWVMGPPARVVASAVDRQGAPGEVSALLSFADGAGATVLASGLMPASYPFTTGFRALFERAAFETRTVIAGGEATSSARLYLEGGEAPPGLPQDNPYQTELEHFVACVRGSADPALLDVERALEALARSRAVQTSLRERREVTMPGGARGAKALDG